MSENKTEFYIFILLFALIFFVFMFGYSIGKKIENKRRDKIQKEYFFEYLREELKHPIDKAHVFFVPDAHRIIIQLPDWVETDIDPNEELVDMDELKK